MNDHRMEHGNHKAGKHETAAEPQASLEREWPPVEAATLDAVPANQGGTGSAP